MKKIYILTFCLLYLAACTTKTETIINEGIKNENTAIIEKYFAYFNNHDWQKMADMYIEKPSMKDPAYGINAIEMTKDSIIEKYTTLGKLIPDVKDSIIKVYPNSKNVIVEFESKGTGPDGKKFILPICTIFEIENGKISKDYTYYDNF